MCRRGRGSGRERTVEEVAGEAALKRRLLNVQSIIRETFWTRRLGKVFTSDNSAREWRQE